ncbi:DUF222 domain-containing protein [Aquihabitans sp. McL0605]|uniref:DUF222 domain-containing protein n=1 Tax=Aquihabitans sp. McL0605 TaxID=3415671 RepID=UPI003CEC1A7B
MASAVRDPQVAAAIDEIGASLGVLTAYDSLPGSCDDALAEVREIEALARRIDAVQIRAVARIDRSGVHKDDGHSSAKVMVRHGANLSDAVALRRDRVMRMERDLPMVAAAHAQGRIGPAQVDRIARVYANRRVRDRLTAADGEVAEYAARSPYRKLDEALTDWERLADEDGAGDRAERSHANRDLVSHRNLDGSRRIEGGCGSMDGQIIGDIIERQVRREWERDWADARCRLGDEATVSDLARTHGQRRFDAVKALLVRGDLAITDLEGGAQTCTDVVIDEVTLERHVAKLFGEDPGPDPRLDTWWQDLTEATGITGVDAEDPVGSDAEEGAAPPDGHGRGGNGLVGFRCGTIDGHPLDPTEATVATLVGQLRRVVVGADSVVLDMGRRQRCFTGARQLAVRLSNATCVWTGCHVPSSQCQCDHLEGFNGPGAGSTNPGNGAPACGRHNRFKEQGFTVVRDQRGRWHVYRPDGTEIT